MQNADAAMIHGIDDLPLAVSTAGIRDALRAMAARRMLPARKSIVGSVVFFMMNTLYYMSSLAYFMDTSGTQQ